MPRHRTRIPLNVYQNARLVGQLRHSPGGAMDFQYDSTWLAWEHAFPVSLSLPLREDRYIGDPVIAVFDNLLPDSDVIRRRIAERIRADGADAYSLLAKIGRECVGAIQLLPDGIEPGPAGIVDGKRVSDDVVARRLGDLTAVPLGLGDDEDFRISLAGAHEKTALLRWRGRWHLPRGSTATTHILKPQIGMLPNGIDLTQSVENEYICMKLTAAFGLPTAQAEIAEFKNHRVLVVERFDRRWTSDGRLLRLPQEDCCQALSVPPSLKYESDGGPGIRSILSLLNGSDTPEADRRLFLKAQIVFWLIGATDGHAKNFSVFIQPGGRFRLTPLYDVLSAQPARTAGQLQKNKMKMALAVGANRHYTIDSITDRHFVESATSNGIPKETVRDIFDELLEQQDVAIESVVNHLPGSFPEALTQTIVSHLKKRLVKLKAT